MSNNHQLAVVIPAYKGTYWSEVLACLAAQTDQRFTVYIGDDAGDARIREETETYREKLNLVYHRFEDNLGGTDLVGHWSRCVALADEPWIWLFSDDDRCDPEIVSSFYHAIEKSDVDVYRFATSTIDGTGNVMRDNDNVPDHEAACAFVLSRIESGRSSFVVEYIFSREAYERENGFVNFPHAWFADDASWVAFSRKTGIRKICGPRVYWRFSDANISGRFQPEMTNGKADALFQYHQWLCRFLDDEPEIAGAVTARIRAGMPRWIYHQLGVAGCYKNRSIAMAQAQRVSTALGVSVLSARFNIFARWVKARF